MVKKIVILCILLIAVSHFLLLYKVKDIEKTVLQLSTDQQEHYAVLLAFSSESLGEMRSIMQTQSGHNSRKLAELSDGQDLFRAQIARMDQRISSDMVAFKMQQQALALAVRGNNGISGAEQDFLETLIHDGIFLFKEQEYILCASTMSDVLSISPESIPAKLYFHASLFYANPMDSVNYDRIRTSLGEVLAADPANQLALEVLAGVAVEHQDWEAAYRYYQRLTDLDFENPDYLNKLVTVCIGMGDLSRAEKEIAVLRRIDPENTIYIYFAALLREDKRDFYLAHELYVESLRISPDYRPSLIGSARTAMILRQYSDAEITLKHKILIHSYEGLKMLADCFYFQDRRELAVETRKAALDLLNLQTVEDCKNAADCYRFIANICYEMGVAEATKENVEKGLDLYQSNSLLLLKAKVLLDAGKTGEARLILNMILGSSEESDSSVLAQVQELLEITGVSVHG